jgi:DNA/RNA-binding domain of Phe-tRNA-synthetase-like protein
MQPIITNTDNQDLAISAEAKQLIAGACIGCAVMSGIKVSPVSQELLTYGSSVLASLANDTPWEEDERIVKLYHCYREFGFNPKKNRPSVAALLKRTSGGIEKFPLINSVVGAYNLASITTRLPMAAYDTSTLTGAVELGIATGSEQFTGIGADASEPCQAGELIYRDTAGVLCRGFNWRDADRSKVTSNSQMITLFIDGFVTPEQMQQELTALTSVMSAYSSGEVLRTFVRAIE